KKTPNIHTGYTFFSFQPKVQIYIGKRHHFFQIIGVSKTTPYKNKISSSFNTPLLDTHPKRKDQRM
ncbi:MAG: hypothetical protein K2P62_11200, partial [Phocaeicola sp.]|nr:hypothetical protein [Phocaeicola sp.]